MRRSVQLGLASLVGSLLLSSSAQAAVIFYSTFNGLQAYGTWGVVASADGWTTSAGPGIELQNNVAGTSFSGARDDVFVELDSHGAGPGLNNSSMSRTIATGGHLILEFLYSPRPGVAAGSNGINVYLNNVLLAPTFTGVGGSNTNWSLKTIDFSAPVNSVLTFSAVGTSDTLGGYIDNIKLSSGAPEPSVWAMMILGFGAVGSLLRRRRAFATA